jgi:hypothetical protein
MASHAGFKFIIAQSPSPVSEFIWPLGEAASGREFGVENVAPVRQMRRL